MVIFPSEENLRLSQVPETVSKRAMTHRVDVRHVRAELMQILNGTQSNDRTTAHGHLFRLMGWPHIEICFQQDFSDQCHIIVVQLTFVR